MRRVSKPVFLSPYWSGIVTAAWFRHPPVNPAGYSVESITPSTVPSPMQLIAIKAGKADAAENTKAGMDLNSRDKVGITTTVGKGSAAESTRAGLSRDTAVGVVMVVAVATRPESLFF